MAGNAYAKGQPWDVTLHCPSGVADVGTVQLQTEFQDPASAAIPISCDGRGLDSRGHTSTVILHPTQTAALFHFDLFNLFTLDCGGSGPRGSSFTCPSGVTIHAS
jgi:hypothetical protein